MLTQIMFYLQHDEQYEDLIYTFSLVVMLGLSVVLGRIRSGLLRLHVAALLGMLNVVIFARSQVFYCVAMVFGSLALSVVPPRPVSAAVQFAWGFGLLMAARLLSILNWVPLRALTNAILLLMILRCIEFSFYTQTALAQTKSLRTRLSIVSLGLLYIAYFPGLWSGPLVPPEVIFGNLLEPRPGTTSPAAKHTASDLRRPETEAAHLSVFAALYGRLNLSFLFPRAKSSLFHIVAFILLNAVFALIRRRYQLRSCQPHFLVQIPVSPFLKYVLVYLYMVLFRARFILAWLIAEVAIFASGVQSDSTLSCGSCLRIVFGESLEKNDPQEASEPAPAATSPMMWSPKFTPCPSDQPSVYPVMKCLQNYSSHQVEFSPDVANVLRHWNQSVQLWFVKRIYKVFKPKSRTLRRSAVSVVSAAWHGIHPGYYLCFLQLPPMQRAQEKFFTAFQQLTRNTFVIHCVGVVMTQILITFAAIPFVCKTLRDTLVVWKTFSFCGFYAIGLLYAGAKVLDVCAALFGKQHQL